MGFIEIISKLFNRLSGFIQISMFVLIAFSAEVYSEESIEYLIYGTSAEPLQIVDVDGSHSGFVTDVINEVFAGSRFTVVPVVKPIIRQKSAMASGKAKRWITYALDYWKNDETWQHSTFSDVDLIPYSLSLGYKKSSQPLVIGQLNRELIDQGVAWIQGFKYPGTEVFSQRYEVELDLAKNHSAMLKMVEAGYAKFFMENEYRMRYVMKKQGVDANDYGFFPLTEDVPSAAITLLMSNDLGSDTINFVNHRLQEMSVSGRLLFLAERYGLQGMITRNKGL